SRADLIGPADDVIVGDHMSRGVPHDAGAGLDDILLVLVEPRALLLAPGKDVQHRWRDGLKQLDGGLLRLAQVTAGGDRSCAGRGGPERDDVWLRDPRRCQQEKPYGDDAREAAEQFALGKTDAGRRLNNSAANMFRSAARGTLRLSRSHRA